MAYLFGCLKFYDLTLNSSKKQRIIIFEQKDNLKSLKKLIKLLITNLVCS